MRGAIPPFSQYAFMAWFAVKTNKKSTRTPLPLTKLFFDIICRNIVTNFIGKVDWIFEILVKALLLKMYVNKRI
jgi:hypothetical protein